MGLFNWFKELGPVGKVGMLAATGTVFCATSYGLYTYFSKLQACGSKDTCNEDHQSDDEALEKRILVLGLDGAGKTTFAAALAQQTLSFREETNPTEGFNVICVTTDGVKLNIWESKWLISNNNNNNTLFVFIHL